MGVEFHSGFLNKYSRVRNCHAEAYLAKHGHLLKWKPKESVLDVGCGTGDISYKYIYSNLPEDISKFVCADIKSEMLQLAKKQFEGKDKVFFEELDIISEIPDDKKAKFDKIFSFYLLMWFENQRKVFENVYHLLKPGGGCFLVLVKEHDFVETIFDLIEKPKWKKFIPNPNEMYPFPYRRIADPVKTITDMMKSIGYVNIKVHKEKSTFVFYSKEEFLGFFRALPNPMSLMTLEEQEDYLKDAVDIAYSKNVIKESGEEGVNGTILVIYAEK